MRKWLKTIWVGWAIISVTFFILPAEGLAQASGSDEVERQIEKLKDKEWQTRWNAAAALGETKDPRAIEPLRAALKDENSYVRMTAVRSLGEIDDPRVIEPLIEALRDESHGVQKNAVLSLKKRTGQDLGKDPDAWLQWWQQSK
ncbi:MAG: HEAT repeat domain-containing protein [Desulfobacterales bacterium]|nr:MAG: HEAT repeat domain-containing protein [Desulfobacterales bacterium]